MKVPHITSHQKSFTLPKGAPQPSFTIGSLPPEPSYSMSKSLPAAEVHLQQEFNKP
jgi:hypothetical protein